MLGGLLRSQSRLLFGIASFCLPGAGNSTASLASYQMAAPPVVIAAKDKQSATIIFLHGLGDTGDGWAGVFSHEIPVDHIKTICPTAPEIPVTLNMGMRMPSWFDLYGLSPDSKEDVDGIEQATKIVHSLIDEEVRAGTPANRIVLGGFSMGGALALYAGLTYDQPLAGILGLSSFLVQRDKVPGAHTANKSTAIFMGHGDADFMVPVSFGQMTAAYLTKFNPNVQLKTYPNMQHGSCAQELTDVKQWLLKRVPKQ